MKVEVDSLQLFGLWLIMIGLLLHSIIFLVTYVKIATHLTPDTEEEKKEGEEEEKKGFPIVRFIFKFRKVAKAVMNEEKREEYKRILSIVDWTIISAFSMIILGFFLVLAGTVF